MRDRSILLRLSDWSRLKWARLRYPFGAFVSWVALVVGVIGGTAAIIDSITENETVREWTFSITLTGIALVALASLAVREMSRVKHVRLARCLPYIGEVSELLRDLRSFLNMHVARRRRGEQVTPDVVTRARDIVEEVLSKYSQMFSTLTASHCRTCIKLIDIGPAQQGNAIAPNDIVVFTLARDALSAKGNALHDKKRAEGRLDKLMANSDFLGLWDPNVSDYGYFFSDDLRDDETYSTSSLYYWKNIAGNPNRLSRSEWPLSYISTIVWPIRQEPKSSLGISDYRTLGFLAVDSPQRAAFDKDAHVPFGAILANALFPILELYNELSGPNWPSLVEDTWRNQLSEAGPTQSLESEK